MNEFSKQFSIEKWTEQAEREWYNGLHKLKYSDFLKTKYWEAVRFLVILRCDAVCERCHKKQTKEVHHLTYDIRGYEHRNLQYLVALCEKCHHKIHKIKGQKTNDKKIQTKAPSREPRRQRRRRP